MKQIKFTVQPAQTKSRFLPKITSRRFAMNGMNSFRNAAYFADILNLPDCATLETSFNTGVPLCDLIKKKIIGVIFADSGVFFTPAHRASATAFLTELAAKTIATRGSRVYPLWNIRNFDDQTGEPTKGGVGNLATTQVTISDAIPAFNLGYKGGEIGHAILTKVEAGNYDVFLVDEAFVVYGAKSGDNMVGYTTEQIYVNPSKFPVSDFVNQYSFSITFASMIEYKSLSAFVVTNSSLVANTGLINVPLSLLSSATNVHKVLPIAAGGTNLETVYGATISGLTWTAKNATTGAAVTVTGVADSPSDDSYAVTIDSTEWTALASGTKVAIYGPTASALAGASVKPYEMQPLIVTKP